MKTVGRSLCACVVLLIACSQGSSTPTSDGGGGGGGGNKGDGGVKDPPWNAAVGERGTFLQTFDGSRWQVRTIGGEDLFAVNCVSHTLGWAAGAGGLVVRTADAGVTFERLATGVTTDLRALRFADGGAYLGRGDLRGLIGLAAGAGGTLLLSRDGGDRWLTVATGASETLRGVAVARAGHVLLAVGDGGLVLRSVDGGGRFERQVIEGAEDLVAAAANDSADLVVVAGRDGGLYESTDRGASFRKVAQAHAQLYGLSVEVEADGAALAVGASGAALLRGAQGWGELATGVTADLHAALHSGEVGGEHLLLAGADGTLLRSTDRGTTWQPVAAGSTATIFGLEDFSTARAQPRYPRRRREAR